MTSPKIYTKKGDDGTTRLFSGKKVNKHNIRIKTCGTLDELNVWIGMIRNFEMDKNTQNTLIIVQKELCQ
jgi:cob(I)alamin adenosyltransferase